MKLSQQKCEACSVGEPPLSRKEALELLREIPLWALKGNAIEREFEFDDFPGSIAFINTVAEVAEEQGHHPDIFIYYSRVRLHLSTHKIDGLSKNDFILAAKIDQLA
jgi:4a-hydroxytetrahydrobiopterin dehydratase